jgi:hypothetical protein
VQGIVSGLGRELSTGLSAIKGVIQTDAAINPGGHKQICLKLPSHIWLPSTGYKAASIVCILSDIVNLCSTLRECVALPCDNAGAINPEGTAAAAGHVR